jgi:hypothetical protein
MVFLHLGAVREDAGTVSRHERPHLPRSSPCWLARALRPGAKVIPMAALSGLHHSEMSAACLTSSSVIAMRGGPAHLPSESHPGPGLRKVEINSPQKRRGDPALTAGLHCTAPQPALKVSRQPEDAPRGPRTLRQFAQPPCAGGPPAFGEPQLASTAAPHLATRVGRASGAAAAQALPHRRGGPITGHDSFGNAMALRSTDPDIRLATLSPRDCPPA